MVSRRKFFSIFIMMAVLLFMFQFSQIVREKGNDYSVNKYDEKTRMNSNNQWTQEEYKTVGSAYLISSKDSEVCQSVAQWCTYTKRELIVASSVNELVSSKDAKNAFLLLDSNSVNWKEDVDKIISFAKPGTVIVLLNLPKESEIRTNQKLKTFLGIKEVKKNVQVQGLYLFDGFLIGGEALYKVQKDEEAVNQDLCLDVPWFLLDKGTKTYMVGLLDEKEVAREQFPAIIWTHEYAGTNVFAVNGDYMEDETGLGFLSAMDYMSSDYVMYPVVNAQNVTIADFPGMSDENDAKLQELYSRNLQSLHREILWPGLLSMAAKNQVKLTTFMNTKVNYSDDSSLEDKYVPFYLQQLRDAQSEAGISFHYIGDTTLIEKAVMDKAFYKNAAANYSFRTAYFEEFGREQQKLIDEGGLPLDVISVSGIAAENQPLLSYVKENVTAQGVTALAHDYSYAKDLKNRSILSALGYSNTVVCMDKVTWPESREERWENYFDTVFSNVSTYWTRNKYFDSTTMSESDLRVRALLNLDYEIQTAEDLLQVKQRGVDKDSWYILRTHDKKITAVTNGDFKKLEEGVYLVHTTSGQMSISFEKSDNILEYGKAQVGNE